MSMPEFHHRKYRDHNAFRNYMGFFSGYWSKLPLLLVVFVIKASPSYLIPLASAEIINLLTAPDDGMVVTKLIWIMIIGCVLVIQNVPMTVLHTYMISVPIRTVERNLRSALCTRLQHLSMSFHSSNKIGKLQNKIIRDVEMIEHMTRVMVDAIPRTMLTIGIIVTVTIIKAPHFLLFYLVMVPVATALAWSVRRSLRTRNREFRHSVEEVSGHVNEMLRLIPITRAHHLEEIEVDRINAKLETVRQKGLRIDYLVSIFGSSSWAILMFFNLGVLGLVAYLYYRGSLNIGVGDVGLLAAYFSQLTHTALEVTKFIPMISRGMESVKSISEVLECPDIEQNDNKPCFENLTGEFKFEHVGFRYPGGETNALEDINLEIKPGMTVALVGPSGAGKSTAANLLIGFIRPTEGKLLIDGKNINDYDLRSYRKFIAVVTQETLLFDGTIKENICYGATPGNEELLQAVADAGLSDMIAEEPEGLETQIRENGARLSGGQKQRIAIARALLRDPKMLILDEATSALDIDSEGRIKRSLDRLIAGRTTFIIAHRLSTIRNADLIVVIDRGRIVERGNHAELLSHNGLYAEMDRKFNEIN